MSQVAAKSVNTTVSRAKDKLFFWAVCFLSSLTAILLFVIIGELVIKGSRQIYLSFFTEISPIPLEAMLANSSG